MPKTQRVPHDGSVARPPLVHQLVFVDGFHEPLRLWPFEDGGKDAHEKGPVHVPVGPVVLSEVAFDPSHRSRQDGGTGARFGDSRGVGGGRT
eukprot:CAMPEP_0113321370 /NCGR_PEP_ID=MMETSP0010_2-20120614/14879_1 /TAXON_ID=216773 ORGANISM="Corethron hystrix, Strain 308" /NCGR_SAMPLE_ID=MMETSP0010_2 /ASSEMBLY_ACC=CAM_ASM_000155 /LENGTH=91 /DNA_ID=CAMNT_0000179485 /DNA_START=418 /DNA_END=689 /DNA_ORIENTATION=- /assembly_acc=CAM_ASM_000155